MKLTNIYSAIFFLSILLFACNQHVDLEPQTLKVSLEAPAYVSNNQTIPHIPGIDANGLSNPDALIHLGRILFYDKALSAGSTVSCGSCHAQRFAFADPFKHSVGIGSQLSERNTPTIINTAFGSGLFWDQSAENLMDLVTRPIANHREMGFSNFDALVAKLNTKEYYPELFRNAFGSSSVTKSGIAAGLAMFVGQLNSFDSEIDRFNSGLGELSEIQLRGMILFEEKQCNSCHSVLNNGELDVFIANDINGRPSSFGYTGAGQTGDIANIGLNQVYEDNGVGALSGFRFDDGKFKIPTLRNIALTAPYMHDGRFSTLHDVLDFYSSGIKPHTNLDSRLKESSGQAMNIDLTETDKSAIIAFLGGLTSHEVINNPMFSDPFE